MVGRLQSHPVRTVGPLCFALFVAIHSFLHHFVHFSFIVSFHCRFRGPFHPSIRLFSLFIQNNTFRVLLITPFCSLRRPFFEAFCFLFTSYILHLSAIVGLWLRIFYVYYGREFLTWGKCWNGERVGPSTGYRVIRISVSISAWACTDCAFQYYTICDFKCIHLNRKTEVQMTEK